MNRYLTINPGDRVCDALAHPTPSVLARNGYKGIAIYWKNTDRVTLDTYHKAGIGTLLIHEWGAADFNTGHTGGVTAGRAARAAADKLGYPADLPMIAADDTDATSRNLAAHKDFVVGFKEGYGNSVGLYGDKDVVEACKNLPVDLFWQPNAWAWSGGRGVYHPLDHVLQGYDVHKIGVDDGVVVRPFRMWLGDSAVPAVVTVPVPTLRTGSTGDQVKLLQTQMKARGWYPYAVDGAFGPRTADGVKHMQTFLRVAVDGVYGPVTSGAWTNELRRHAG